MTPVTAADCKHEIVGYARKRWPYDNNISAAPKLQNAINSILRQMSKGRDRVLSISHRRATSYLNGESTAKLNGYEVAAIRELLEGATDEEKEIFGQIEKLSAEIERQGQIIESLKKQMAGQSS